MLAEHDFPPGAETNVFFAVERISGRTGKPVTAAEVYRCIRRKGDNKERIESALKGLAAIGRLRAIPSPMGKVGRPTVRYELV